MKIVLLGDSLIYGYGVPYGSGWAHQYDNNTNNIVINKGINGNSTNEMINRFSTDVIAHNPDYVLIMGGSNDLVFGLGNVNTILKNIKAMIEKAKENNIQPIIGIPPMADHEMATATWSDGVDYNKMNIDLKNLKANIYEIAKEEGLLIVDFNTALKDKINEQNKRDYLIDGLHPSIKGQNEMYKIFLEAVKNL